MSTKKKTRAEIDAELAALEREINMAEHKQILPLKARYKRLKDLLDLFYDDEPYQSPG